MPTADEVFDKLVARVVEGEALRVRCSSPRASERARWRFYKYRKRLQEAGRDDKYLLAQEVQVTTVTEEGRAYAVFSKREDDLGTALMKAVEGNL